VWEAGGVSKNSDVQTIPGEKIPIEISMGNY